MVLFLSSFSSSSELGTPSSLRQNGWDRRIPSTIRSIRSFLIPSFLDSMFPGSFWIRSLMQWWRIIKWPQQRRTGQSSAFLSSLRDSILRFRKISKRAFQKQIWATQEFGELSSSILPMAHRNQNVSTATVIRSDH
jgi:hypothetical protein